MTKAPPWVLVKLKRFATDRGFVVTAGSGGRHNTGSLHALNRAVDVRTRGKTWDQVQRFMAEARAAGYRVIDERIRPVGQKVHTGPHLHVEDRRSYE